MFKTESLNLNRNLLFSFFLLLICVGCNKKEGLDKTTDAETYLNNFKKVEVTTDNYLGFTDSLYNLSKINNYQKGIAKSYFFKGKYFSAKGKNIEALENFNQAVKLSEQTNDLLDIGDAYYSLGSYI